MATIFAETERFILREITPDDVDNLFELDSDPDVHRYLGNQPVTSKEQIVSVIQSIRRQYVDNGIGRWAVIDKETGNFLGWTGLKLMTETTNGHVNYYDLGYRFIRKYWGQGIATETAKASLAYAFDTLNSTEVFAMAECGNAGSDHVLRKAGLHFIETFDLDGMQHNWYRIDSEMFGSKPHH